MPAITVAATQRAGVCQERSGRIHNEISNDGERIARDSVRVSTAFAEIRGSKFSEGTGRSERSLDTYRRTSRRTRGSAAQNCVETV
jgi:hypothetical protein